MTDSRNPLEQKKSVEPLTNTLKKQAIVTKSAPIIMQAKDTAHHMPAYLDTKSLASVSAVCHGACTIFSEPLSKRALQKLLQHVAYGEQDQAEAIIRNQPELLLKTDTVTDPAGRRLLNVTPITAAYGAEDDKMCEMMFTYLDTHSRDTAIQHIKITFPEEKESVSYNFSHIVAAITANENIDGTLEQFRNDFTPGVIEKGKHFNMKILLDAYQAYSENYHLWSPNQCSLFFRLIIGYLQRLLTACYAQAFCQGFYNVIEGGKTLQRGLKLAGGATFYPENLKLKSGLGFDFGIYSYVEGTEFRGGGMTARAREYVRRILKSYVEQKQHRFASLCNVQTGVRDKLNRLSCNTSIILR